MVVVVMRVVVKVVMIRWNESFKLFVGFAFRWTYRQRDLCES